MWWHVFNPGTGQAVQGQPKRLRECCLKKLEIKIMWDMAGDDSFWPPSVYMQLGTCAWRGLVEKKPFSRGEKRIGRDYDHSNI